MTRKKNVTQSIEHTTLSNSIIIQADGDVNIDKDFVMLLTNSKSKISFINRTVKSEIKKIEQSIIKGEINDAKKVVDSILFSNLDCLSDENRNMVNFFKVMLVIRDSSEEDFEEFEVFLELITDENLLNTVYFAQNVRKSEDWKTYTFSILKVDDVHQALIIDILLSRGEYQHIIDSFYDVESSSHFLDFQLGICYLNLGMYRESILKLNEAVNKEKNDKYLFCKSISDIYISLEVFDGGYESIKNIDMLSENLIEYGEKCIEFREINIEIYSLALLGALSVSKIDRFISEFEKLKPEFKEMDQFLYILGNYHMNSDNCSDAIRAFSKIKGFMDEKNLVHKLVLCNYTLGNYEKVIEIFKETIHHSDSKIASIYLAALFKMDFTLADEKFEEVFELSCFNLEDVVHFIELNGHTDNSKEVIYKKVIQLLEELYDITVYHKIALAFFVSDMSNLNLAKEVLSTISSFNNIQIQYIEFQLRKIPDLVMREKLSEWFFDNNFKTISILEILLDLYTKNNKHSSAFHILQEMFALSKSKHTAVLLLNYALFAKAPYSEVEQYFEYLKRDNNPSNLLIQAQTYLHYGNREMANNLAYKAIFMMKNVHDEKLYGQYLSIKFKMIEWESLEESQINRVDLDTIVFLSKVGRGETEGMIKICINSSSEYRVDEQAIGLLHLSKSNSLYYRIINRKLKDIVEYEGNKYQIIEILDKDAYVFSYVLDKSKDSENGPILAYVCKEEGKDEIDQITDLLKKSGNVSPKIEEYYRKFDSFGIPIEFIATNGYDEYVNSVNYLLFSEESGILYAGTNRVEITANIKYTISLSTLTVLACIDQLSLLENFLDKIRITESLLSFIQEQSEKASHRLIKSFGKISVDENDRLVFFEDDDTLIDFWNSIYELAQKFSIEYVEVSERFEFNKSFKDFDIESLFSNTGIHVCQLDAMISAVKHKEVLISNDDFFSKLANHIGLATVNHTHLYSMLSTNNFKKSIIQLLETNFVCIEMITDDESIVTSFNEYKKKNKHIEKYYNELHSKFGYR